MTMNVKDILRKFDSQVSESSLSRVYNHSKNHDIGTITAFRYAKNCGEGDIYTKKKTCVETHCLKQNYIS